MSKKKQRKCKACKTPLPDTKRPDSHYCNPTCRKRGQRFRERKTR